MTDPEQISDSTRRAATVMVVLNSISTAMMLTGVNVALPEIARALEIDAVGISWIPMAYLMASAACVLGFGRLADMYGRKRIYLLGSLGIVLTSVFTASAGTETQLLFGRFLQGVFAAMVFATNVAIVSSVYPPAKRGTAIGYAVSAIYLGLSLGPLVSGWLVETISWRATFLVHLPLSFLVLYIGVFRVPAEWRADERGSFDLIGASLYGVAITVMMAGVTRLPSLDGAAMIVLGIVGIVFFFRHEHSHPYPVFDVELFYTNRLFIISCLASLVMYTATFANVVLVSLYLQYLKGVSPSVAGVIMMVQPIVLTFLSPMAGRLADRVQPRVLASAGMAVTSLGLFCLSALNGSSSLSFVVLALAITGLGLSLFTTPNANAIMGSVERSDYGRAGSANSVMRVVGQMTSMGLVAMIFALILGPRQITPALYPELNSSISTTFVVAAVLCAAGVMLSYSRGRTTPEAPAPG